MASNRGTLMELGTGPLITAGMVIQFLTASGFIKLNMNNKEEREVSNSL